MPAKSDFRCSSGSADDAEELAGTAPTEATWLLLEYAGSWGARALEESRLPEAVKEGLTQLEGVRVQLIRRHGGSAAQGVRVFTAQLAQQRFQTTVLTQHDEVLSLDFEALAAGEDPGLTTHDGPLWLVCTNGKRDRCCAEIGRPIARALSEHWPEETWETNHLGGHRFSGTLLALPTGLTLGRVTQANAVELCAQVLSGSVPVPWCRGRAGLPGAAQVAELHAWASGAQEVHWRPPLHESGGLAQVDLLIDGQITTTQVEVLPGPARRQSCADLNEKATTTYAVRA